jgi:hypothetical protein
VAKRCLIRPLLLLALDAEVRAAEATTLLLLLLLLLLRRMLLLLLRAARNTLRGVARDGVEEGGRLVVLGAAGPAGGGRCRRLLLGLLGAALLARLLKLLAAALEVKFVLKLIARARVLIRAHVGAGVFKA